MQTYVHKFVFKRSLICITASMLCINVNCEENTVCGAFYAEIPFLLMTVTLTFMGFLHDPGNV